MIAAPPDLDAMVTEVWPTCEAAVRSLARSRGLDYLADELVGAAAVRVVEAALRWEPSRSSWRTWAINQARYAALDAMRHSDGGGVRAMRQRGEDVPTTVPLCFEAYTIESGEEPVGHAAESADELARLARQAGRAGRVLPLIYGRDLNQFEAAAALGVNQSRVSVMHREALAELRRVLDTPPPVASSAAGRGAGGR